MPDSPEGIDDQQPAPKDNAPIQTDLYCLECGYNLRGLSGDPVRCPECGNFNPIALIEVPADEIRRQLKKMESAPTFSVVGFLVTALLAAVIVAMLINGASSDSTSCPLIGMVLALLFWIGGVSSYRESCRGKAGWLSALLRFQVVAVLLVAGVGGSILGAVAVLIELGDRSIGSGTALTVLGVLVAVVVAAVLWGLRPLHRWLKAPMERLQRQVAVEIARKRLRKKMHREKRWMKSR